ncbi:hypothetical protein B2G88_16240 [Natronolimnobius baerhuensis]|uniref:Uncharacterized protein n=2 Tax=Natronolimnobius baerhuensis TaxID=253108 RepID=A0A202E766_9EURY|nr:hypothetical protein B2G88_16240 [Natronolimnobius baerhuensis]
MTPATLLVLFCAVMLVVAIGRFILAQRRDWVDFGAILVVFGITVLSGLWLVIVRSWTELGGWLTVAAIGIGMIALGLVQIVRYWNEPRYESTQSLEDNGF